LYCRAENNRFFLRKNIEMRPGFLAKWIEFKIRPKVSSRLDNVDNSQNQ